MGPEDGKAPPECPGEWDGTEMKCFGGYDAKGCPMPDTCQWVDPYCPTNCPVVCGENEMQCSGGYDYNGKCPQPDVCVPMNEDCPSFCPVNCGQHEMFCPGGVDAKCCPKEDFCQHTDPWA